MSRLRGHLKPADVGAESTKDASQVDRPLVETRPLEHEVPPVNLACGGPATTQIAAPTGVTSSNMQLSQVAAARSGAARPAFVHKPQTFGGGVVPRIGVARSAIIAEDLRTMSYGPPEPHQGKMEVTTPDGLYRVVRHPEYRGDTTYFFISDLSSEAMTGEQTEPSFVVVNDVVRQVVLWRKDSSLWAPGAGRIVYGSGNHWGDETDGGFADVTLVSETFEKVYRLRFGKEGQAPTLDVEKRAMYRKSLPEVEDEYKRFSGDDIDAAFDTRLPKWVASLFRELMNGER